MPEPITKEQLKAVADKLGARLKERNPELHEKVEPKIIKALEQRQEKGN